MKVRSTKTREAERSRRLLVKDLAKDHGSDWVEQYRPGSHGCHELLDRTAMVADLVDQHIRSHPACVQSKQWFALADRAVNALCELYQQVGAQHLEADTEPTR